ncbi:MAG: hypothetical protein H6581_29980 [Bacteroidia bacterium]|nr:hypothetical protein [Bacteroidia bacterium]
MRKFLLLLFLLKKDELAVFSHFLLGPEPENQIRGKKIIRPFLNLVLEKIIPERLAEKLKAYTLEYQQECWDFAYPGKAFDKRLIADGFAPLNKALRSFVSRHQLMQDNQVLLDVYFLEFLRDRQAPGLYAKLSVEEREEGKPSGYTFAELDRCFRENLEAFNGVLFTTHFGEEERQLASEHLFAGLKAHREAAELRELRLQVISQDRFPLLPFPPGHPASNPIKEAFELILKGLRKQITVEEFLSLANLILEGGFPADSTEGREILKYAVNLGTDLYLIPAHALKVRPGLARLYMEAADRGLLQENGVIPAQHYANACILACTQAKFSWAETFSREHEGLLDKTGQKEGLLHFNLAHIHWRKGEAKAALRELRSFKPGKKRLSSRYVQEIKVLAEYDDEACLHKIEAYLKFLDRLGDRNLQPAIALQHDRALLIRRILKAPSYGGEHWGKLKEAAQAFPFDLEWLLSLIDQRSA